MQGWDNLCFQCCGTVWWAFGAHRIYFATAVYWPTSFKPCCNQMPSEIRTDTWFLHFHYDTNSVTDGSVSNAPRSAVAASDEIPGARAPAFDLNHIEAAGNQLHPIQFIFSYSCLIFERIEQRIPDFALFGCIDGLIGYDDKAHSKQKYQIKMNAKE